MKFVVIKSQFSLSRESDSNLNSDVTRPWDGFTFHLLGKHVSENSTIWSILFRILRIFPNLAAGQTDAGEEPLPPDENNRRRRSGPPQAHGQASQHGHGRTPAKAKPRAAKRTEENRMRTGEDAYPVRRSLQPDQLSAHWAWNPGASLESPGENSPPETRIQPGGRS